MKVYLDNCVYNRPFDEHQTQEKIFIEAMAFYLILKWVEEDKIELINSDALVYENEKTSDYNRRFRIKTYLSLAKQHIELSGKIIERAQEIIKLGFGSMDALHIAMAEHSGADYFVTCDDIIINIWKKSHNKLKVKILGILEFIMEVVHA